MSLVDSYFFASLACTTDPLTIVVQPADQADCKGNKATFTVVATGGSGPIHFFWKRKRLADSTFAEFGAKDSTKLPVYNIGTGIEAPDGTLYQVTVSDQLGAVVSNIARLTVNAITGIAPVGVATYTLNQGGNIWFKVLTSGNTPSAYQWIKRQGIGIWRDLADNSIITGSQGEQLSFNHLSLPDSGLYKLRVTFPTISNNYCTETSTITRKINVLPVVDTMPPLFVNLSDEVRLLCPTNLEMAYWDYVLENIVPEGKSFYYFAKNNPLLNLSTTSFSDNITPSADLLLHWGIYTMDNLRTPIMDLSGTILDDRTGQISNHPENFELIRQTADNPSFQVTYWLEDLAGNLTPDSLRHRLYLSIINRPEIISSF
jgi:hypothetical protein